MQAGRMPKTLVSQAVPYAKKTPREADLGRKTLAPAKEHLGSFHLACCVARLSTRAQEVGCVMNQELTSLSRVAGKATHGGF
jgi:hypothetical protein